MAAAVRRGCAALLVCCAAAPLLGGHCREDCRARPASAPFTAEAPELHVPEWHVLVLEPVVYDGRDIVVTITTSAAAALVVGDPEHGRRVADLEPGAPREVSMALPAPNEEWIVYAPSGAELDVAVRLRGEQALVWDSMGTGRCVHPTLPEPRLDARVVHVRELRPVPDGVVVD